MQEIFDLYEKWNAMLHKYEATRQRAVTNRQECLQMVETEFAPLSQEERNAIAKLLLVDINTTIQELDQHIQDLQTIRDEAWEDCQKAIIIHEKFSALREAGNI